MVCQKLAIRKLSGIYLKLDLHAGGKLTFKHVKGGVKLVETDFTIKDDTLIKSIENLDKKKGKKRK